MYDIISAFQCYTISVDVYFPFHCTLWMTCFTFLLILCCCYCAHDNDVSHTLHRERGVTTYLHQLLQATRTRPLGSTCVLTRLNLAVHRKCYVYRVWLIL